jgi:Uma2 family endonuclease
MSVAVNEQISVGYAVPRWSPAWAIPEVPVPESQLHDHAIEYLRGVLLAWVARKALDATVFRNIGIRWIQSEPKCGFDPDVSLVTPAPPAERGGITSLKLWQPGHTAPKLAIEVVSKNHPYKDYVDAPDRAAACGVQELWLYDPQGFGRRTHGGPHLLSVWHRGERGFERCYAGDGPGHSPLLSAWLFPTATNDPARARLRVAGTRQPEGYWPTLSEQDLQAEERARLDAERARLDAERARLDAERERDALAKELAELRERQRRDD